MDDFYSALSQGHVKASGIMNYMQHLFIAQRADQPAGRRVLDVCCGRGLLVPLLARYAPRIAGYVGVDISSSNLREALTLRKAIPALPFSCAFVQADAATLSDVLRTNFGVIAYTSAIEHLPRVHGVRSLRAVAQLLAREGTLFLSTPRTINGPRLQYRVHVYEWDRPELETTLDACGLRVNECIGLLPPEDDVLEAAILAQFGFGAVRWYRAMRSSVPIPFLAPVLAAALPGVAKELMFVCSHKEA